MRPIDQFKNNLMKYRPAQYKREKAAGTLDQLAERAEQGYLEALTNYRSTGISTTDAIALAEQDWLLPMSEQEEREQVKELQRQENEQAERQAVQMTTGLQGYDPNNKKPQRFNLGNGKSMTKMPGLEMVYPTETIESTPKRSEKDPPPSSTETT